MRILILALFAAGIQMAHAESAKESIIAGVSDGQITVTFQGEIAKDIYDGMPEGSKVLPTKKCQLAPLSDRITKVRGGFTCSFYPRSKGLDLAYMCYLDASMKTGKAVERKPQDICDSDDQ